MKDIKKEVVLLLVLKRDLKNNLKNEKYEFCPLCGSKIQFYVEEPNDKKPSELDLINENDWLLP